MRPYGAREPKSAALRVAACAIDLCGSPTTMELGPRGDADSAVRESESRLKTSTAACGWSTSMESGLGSVLHDEQHFHLRTRPGNHSFVASITAPSLPSNSRAQSA